MPDPQDKFESVIKNTAREYGFDVDITYPEENILIVKRTCECGEWAEVKAGITLYTEDRTNHAATLMGIGNAIRGLDRMLSATEYQYDNAEGKRIATYHRCEHATNRLLDQLLNMLDRRIEEWEGVNTELSTEPEVQNRACSAAMNEAKILRGHVRLIISRVPGKFDKPVVN